MQTLAQFVRSAVGLLYLPEIRQQHCPVSDQFVDHPDERCLGLPCPQNIAIKLLDVPLMLFDKKSYERFPAYVSDAIDDAMLSSMIVEKVNCGRWNSLTAPVYIRYCLEHGLRECKEAIVGYTLNRKLNDGYAYCGVEYLSKLFGTGVLMEEILSECSDDSLLYSLAYQIPFDQPSKALDDRLCSAYKKTGENKWMVLLLSQGNQEALNDFCMKAKAIMTLPDMVAEPAVPEMTEAISQITNEDNLEILVELIKLTCHEAFSDRQYFGLRHSCWNAIKSIAKGNYSKLLERLSSLRNYDNSDFDALLSDLMRSITEDEKDHKDKPMDFDIALSLIP